MIKLINILYHKQTQKNLVSQMNSQQTSLTFVWLNKLVTLQSGIGFNPCDLNDNSLSTLISSLTPEFAQMSEELEVTISGCDLHNPFYNKNARSTSEANVRFVNR